MIESKIASVAILGLLVANRALCHRQFCVLLAHWTSRRVLEPDGAVTRA
jgi:hypothetical protein